MNRTVVLHNQVNHIPCSYDQVNGDPVTVFVFDCSDKPPDDVSPSQMRLIDLLNLSSSNLETSIYFTHFR